MYNFQDKNWYINESLDFPRTAPDRSLWQYDHQRAMGTRMCYTCETLQQNMHKCENSISSEINLNDSDTEWNTKTVELNKYVMSWEPTIQKMC